MLRIVAVSRYPFDHTCVYLRVDFKSQIRQMVLLPWQNARKVVLLELCITGFSVLVAYSPLKQHSSQHEVAQIKALSSVLLNRNTERSQR